MMFALARPIPKLGCFAALLLLAGSLRCTITSLERAHREAKHITFSGDSENKRTAKGVGRTQHVWNLISLRK